MSINGTSLNGTSVLAIIILIIIEHNGFCISKERFCYSLIHCRDQGELRSKSYISNLKVNFGIEATNGDATRY